MKNKWNLLLIVAAFAFSLAGCQDAPAVVTSTAVARSTVETAEPLPTAVPLAKSGLFISEILLGVPGGNQEEFIELYNAGAEPVELQGYSLWYRLRDNQDEQPLYTWEDSALIPGQGHYLLVREGHDFGLMPDALFSTALYEGNGGLALRDAGGSAVDQVGWGAEAPAGYVAGSPIMPEISGGSLERLPGGDAGNGLTTGSNDTDFMLTAAPNPQNSGSDPTPLPEQRLAIRLAGPKAVAPLEEFETLIIVENLTGEEAAEVHVSIPVSPDYTVVALPEGAVVENGRFQFTIPQLPAGAVHESRYTLQAPLSYSDTHVSGYYAEAEGGLAAFGMPFLLPVQGGTLPINVTRDLVGNVVTVEGIATMYTGGFFAGSSTKFYVEDETGGIQVYVPGGLGADNVAIGDQVRVVGEIETYRDSLELVPASPADVEIMARAVAEPQPSPITILDNENNDAVLGRLNVIEGTVSRIEEFSYSYEVDLTDGQGQSTLVYIEKDTGVTPEPLDLGKMYRIIGISEFYSGYRQLKPRLQTDIAEIFPPVLLLELEAVNSVTPGDLITYTLTAVNHTTAPLTTVQITAVPPTHATVTEILNDGELADDQIIWTIPELAGDGAETAVQFIAQVEAEAAVAFPAASATADQWPEPAVTQPFLTFVGSGVPIWAIQGPGEASPYVRSTVTTNGVVTAVFPELGGFWLQEMETDDDPATSAGVFVLLEPLPAGLAAGDSVQVTGRVREVSGQTLIQPAEATAVVSRSTGNALPAAVPYNPPADPAEALLYNEALEGMLVTLSGPAVAIAPTTKYGESVLVYQAWGVTELPRTAAAGYTIMVDDGSAVAHADASTLPYTIAKGDVVTALTGPLAFTFDNYKIEPLAVPEIVESERPLPTLPAPAPDEITIATFNVENLFDNKEPNPADPPKPSRAVYQTKLNRLADVIVALGAPTILGLQEVENLGVLEDLAALEQLADFQYQPYLIEGTDERGIDVAYLVRGDLAVVDGVAAYPAPEGLTSRPPLVLTATINLESGPETLVVLNNHFTSLAAGEAATEPRRTAQAAWNVTLVTQILAANPEAQIVVLGDLNSFYQTLPLDTLQNGGLAHAFDSIGPDEALPYTYIFEGKTQSLDHILMTPNLFARLGSVDALHINADFPLPLPDAASPRRVSDHDPLLVRFSFSH